MICFPNCKINLGLYITAKRSDGFHDLETVFYPINWCDAVEMIEHPLGKDFELQLSGHSIDGPIEKNILYKAWDLLNKQVKVPPLLVHLLKKIPMGAGLGGGSADAAFFLELLNNHFSLGLGESDLHNLTLELGSDCPFFLKNVPVHATGRGEVFSPVNISLDNYFILLVFPGIHSNTKQAFGEIRPGPVTHNLVKSLNNPVEQWRNTITNDFEAGLFKRYPMLAELKQSFYDAGALYSSMSGSGSTVFGIFENAPDPTLGKKYQTHIQAPKTKIL